MKKYLLKTLGCKANFYDSQLIEAELQKRGWTPSLNSSASSSDQDAVLCIVNSCTVTDEADRQTRKLAAKLSRTVPGARVVVTGCAAEVDPERLAQSKGIHYVIGNQNKPELVELILKKLEQEERAPEVGEVLGAVQSYEQMISRHPMDREWPEVDKAFFAPPVHLDGLSAKTRAFLKIQEGCNSFCTYCVIPYGRGPSRSLRPKEVLEQVRALVASGVREIVITGTNIGDYGMDWSEIPALGDLLEMILSETSLERLRVSSLDPTEITSQIIQLMENNPRFCPHFHVSLQSANDRVLKLMKRKYTTKEVKECLTRIAEIPAPYGGVFVGMDVITGFPGEGEEEFESGYELLKALPWSRLHVFPYSERSGTPATRLPHSVPKHIRALRAKKLGELSLERLKAHYQRVRQEAEELSQILLEKECRGPGQAQPQPETQPEAQSDTQWIGGYTPNYLRVLIRKPRALRKFSENELVSAPCNDVWVDPTAGDAVILSYPENPLNA